MAMDNICTSSSFYAVYLSLNNSNYLSVNSLINNLKLSIILIDFCPIFVFIAVIFLIIGLMKSSIVFSHWKDQTKRTQDINDIFDIYDDVIVKIYCRRKRHLVIIEDWIKLPIKILLSGF